MANSPSYSMNLKNAPHGFDHIVDNAAKTHLIDPALIKAVIKAESNYEPNSVSPKGAMGLMQLMPQTAEELGVKNPFDPVENIMGGTRYLSSLLDKYNGNVRLALAAYNWGPGNIDRSPMSLPQETRVYIDRVARFNREYSS